MKFDLEQLGIDELIQHEHLNVMENITDVNCSPIFKRKIILELEYEVTHQNQLRITPTIKNRLASIKTNSLPFYFNRNGELFIADPDQIQINNVSKMKEQEVK